MGTLNSMQRGAVDVACTDGAAPPPAYDGPLLIFALAPHPGAIEALRDRWLALVDKDADGCWHWRGAKTSKGLPHLRLDAWHTVGAARVALLLLGVPLPVRARVRRICETADCVSPHHHVASAFARGRRSSGRVQSPRLSPETQARIVLEAAAGVPRRVLAMRYQRPLRTIAAVIERARAQTAPKEN